MKTPLNLTAEELESLSYIQGFRSAVQDALTKKLDEIEELKDDNENLIDQISDLQARIDALG